MSQLYQFWELVLIVRTFPSPEGTNIKAWGETSEREWNLRSAANILPTLKGSNIFALPIAPLQGAGIVLRNSWGAAHFIRSTPGFNICPLWARERYRACPTVPDAFIGRMMGIKARGGNRVVATLEIAANRA